MQGNAMLAVTLATLTLMAHQTTALVVSVNMNRAKLILKLGDSNENGVLSLNETAELLQHLGTNRTVNRLAHFDTDHDGNLSFPEISRALSITANTLIWWLDTDGDGLLSIPEVEAFAAKFGITLPAMIISMVLDTDQDGYVSVDEIEGAPSRLMGLMKFVPALLNMWLKSKFQRAEQSLETVVRKLFVPQPGGLDYDDGEF